jgi:hypothetical protein
MPVLLIFMVKLTLWSTETSGPDSHGRVGRNGASNQPQGYDLHYRNTDVRYFGRNVTGEPNALDLCPSPHFTMTERNGCQPGR